MMLPRTWLLLSPPGLPHSVLGVTAAGLGWHYWGPWGTHSSQSHAAVRCMGRGGGRGQTHPEGIGGEGADLELQVFAADEQRQPLCAYGMANV